MTDNNRRATLADAGKTVAPKLCTMLIMNIRRANGQFLGSFTMNFTIASARVQAFIYRQVFLGEIGGPLKNVNPTEVEFADLPIDFPITVQQEDVQLRYYNAGTVVARNKSWKIIRTGHFSAVDWVEIGTWTPTNESTNVLAIMDGTTYSRQYHAFADGS